MYSEDRAHVRRELLDLLMEKVESDPYPSTSMLNTIESLLTPEEMRDYAEGLLERVRADKYPSWPLIHRLLQFA